MSATFISKFYSQCYLRTILSVKRLSTVDLPVLNPDCSSEYLCTIYSSIRICLLLLLLQCLVTDHFLYIFDVLHSFKVSCSLTPIFTKFWCICQVLMIFWLCNNNYCFNLFGIEIYWWLLCLNDKWFYKLLLLPYQKGFIVLYPATALIPHKIYVC